MPKDGVRLDELEGTVCGPKDTPYEGGCYTLKFSIPKSYPFDAPKVGILLSSPVDRPMMWTHFRSAS